MRQDNGLEVKVEAKEKMEHAVVDEARIPTTTIPTIKEKKTQLENEKEAKTKIKVQQIPVTVLQSSKFWALHLWLGIDSVQFVSILE